MKRPAIPLLATLTLLFSSLACALAPRIRDLDISVPTIEVGEDREETHRFPLAGAGSASLATVFGAGRLHLSAGAPDDLLSGVFRYNVPAWAPEIEHQGNTLTVRQGGDEGRWGIPSGNVRNRWELEVSPLVPVDLNLKAGAGEGVLDLTGLQIAALDLNLGAGAFVLRFDEPNQTAMDHLTLDAGASKLDLIGLGNASPATMRLQGGVGDIQVDLTGPWAQSAEIEIRAGAGALALRLPDDVGVQVEVRKGLANVDAYGLRQMGTTYTNDLFGETETELDIDVIAGVGTIRLIVEGAID